MKKLPYCALLAGALFVVIGTRTVFQLVNRTEPMGLLFPLLWDILMVALCVSIVLKCEIARKANIAWAIFCILTSFALAIGTLQWFVRPGESDPGTQRILFMGVSILFGFVFGIWQLYVLRHHPKMTRIKAGIGSGGEKSLPIKHAH